MPQPWRKQQNQDKYFRQAKSEGYRARSAYKLIEINDRYHLIQPGAIVLDLGAAPGSWTQVATELGANVIAVDLQPIEPIKGALVLRGDITAVETIDQIKRALPDRVDAVISDVSPALSGINFVDHARSIQLASMSLQLARQYLKDNGGFVVKVFEGKEFEKFVTQTKKHFREVKIVRPDATHRESREHYVVGLGYKLKRQPRDVPDTERSEQESEGI